jgi:hypothetical protein
MHAQVLGVKTVFMAFLAVIFPREHITRILSGGTGAHAQAHNREFRSILNAGHISIIRSNVQLKIDCPVPFQTQA